MKLYNELADWWPLLSPPDGYAEEAAFFHQLLEKSCSRSLRTVLELGSGGGNNAFHLSRHYSMTLVDASVKMLAVSRKLNLGCEHLVGDMREVRLGRQFDAVFVHDAVSYMTSENDLAAAIRTAFEHTSPGGVALFVPDFVRETFSCKTEHGGVDDGERGLRFLEWTFDPDPSDTTYVSCFVVALREASGAIRTICDEHREGLFSRNDWMQLLRAAGFDPEIVTDKWAREVFVARRPQKT